MCRGVAAAVGCRICDLRRPKSRLRSILISPRIDHFRRRVAGRRIAAVRRVGKRVVFEISGATAGLSSSVFPSVSPRTAGQASSGTLFQRTARRLLATPGGGGEPIVCGRSERLGQRLNRRWRGIVGQQRRWVRPRGRSLDLAHPFQAAEAGPADHPVHFLPVDHHDEAGDIADAVFSGQRPILIDVYPPDGIALLDQCLDGGIHCPARATPIGVEVQQHGLARAGKYQSRKGRLQRDHRFPPGRCAKSVSPFSFASYVGQVFNLSHARNP